MAKTFNDKASEQTKKNITKTDTKTKKTMLEIALEGIETAHGKGAVMLMGSKQIEKHPSISTGVMPLDIALGIGGVPRGRIVELMGWESSGKTSLALSIVAEAQRQGGTAAIVDAEHALDPAWATKLGVDIDALLISQPDNGEQALEILEALIRSNSLSVIVVDSVAALVPRAEIEGNMGDSHMGLQARLMSQAMRKIVGSIYSSGTCVIFINQYRKMIGGMTSGNNTTTGGNALKFYASIRLEVARIGAVKQGDEIIGNQTQVKIKKNKLAPPFKQVVFDLYYEDGFSREASIIDVAVEKEIVAKAGTWFSYGKVRLGQGKEKSRLFLKENPEILTEISDKILIATGLVEGEIVEAVTETAKVETTVEISKKSRRKK